MVTPSQLYTISAIVSNMLNLFYRIQTPKKIVFDATNNAHYTLKQ